jgi:hypothetical protein
VLGLGLPYSGYGDKIRLYMQYLIDNHATKRISDDDIVLLIDAYDVLLFPSIKYAGHLLQQSASAVIFCAEFGHYPEFSGIYFSFR